MDLSKAYSKLERTLKKTPPSLFILLMLITTYVLYKIYRVIKPVSVKEGFIDQSEDVVVKKDFDSYDDFYVDVYDDLFYEDLVNEYEVGSIENITEPDSESKVLQIGSRTGKIANSFKKKDINIIGMDESKAMVDKAKKAYPSIEFKVGSPLKAFTFDAGSFTHILCLDNTFYYYKDQKQFIENVYNWLIPGGYFVLQLADKDMFDPQVPASKPYWLINPQSHSEKRITKSKVVFNNFDYTSNFEVFPNDFVQFREIFKDDNGKMRENEHNMKMPSIKSVINMAKETGFIVYAEVDLLMCKREYQYLYIFQKPV